MHTFSNYKTANHSLSYTKLCTKLGTSKHPKVKKRIVMIKHSIMRPVNTLCKLFHLYQNGDYCNCLLKAYKSKQGRSQDPRSEQAYQTLPHWHDSCPIRLDILPTLRSSRELNETTDCSSA